MKTNNFHVDLTDEQVVFFQQNGYLSIPRITTDDEIEWLKGIYDELFTERTGEEQGRYFDLAGPRAHSGKETLPQVLRSRSTVPRTPRIYLFPKCTATRCETAECRKGKGWRWRTHDFEARTLRQRNTLASGRSILESRQSYRIV